MRSFVYFLITCLSITIASAQTSFTLNPRVATTSLANTETVNVSTVIKNNTTNAGDSMFKWTITNIDMPSQWSIASICDPKDCYFNSTGSPMIEGYNKTFKLKQSGQSSFVFDIGLNNTGGNGTFKIVIQSTLTSSNVDTFTLLMNSWMTGVNDVSRNSDIKSDIKFYPNPVKDQLTLKYTTNSPVTVDIYNIIGVKVKSFVHDGSTSMVNVSDLQNGVYFIRIKGTSYSKSFTKSE